MVAPLPKQLTNYSMLGLLRLISISATIAIITLATRAQPASEKRNNPTEVVGEATNNLQPHLFIEQYQSGWSLEIELFAQTNFQQNTWLKITNREGCKLQCWLTNGLEVPLTNSSIIDAKQLPSRTAVSNILQAVPRNRRGLQWWPVAG